MTARPWTNPELHRLRQLRLDGLTRREIAKHLNRSYGSILAQCHLRGFKKPVKDSAVSIEFEAISKDLVCDWYEKGWRFEQFTSDGLCVMRKERRL